MIGNAERLGLFGRGRRRRPPKRFFAVDGGMGAHIVEKLAHMKPALRRVASPRHANLLLVVSPLSARMREPLVEVASAMAQPSQAVVIESGRAVGQALDTGPLLRHAEHVSSASAESIFRCCFDAAIPTLAVGAVHAWKREVVDLSDEPKEMETEQVVLSVGPVQSCTAGPLRMLLVCDGEQILRAELGAGYAYRGVGEEMLAATWREAAEIAAALDPLAPFAGRLAFVRAIETLQHKAAEAERTASREAILARERAHNTLWWFVRFADLLGLSEMTRRTYAIAVWLDDCVGRGNEKRASRPRNNRGPDTSALVRDVETLASDAAHSPLIGLRCKGIGALTLDDAVRHGISGPSLAASRNGNGDVHERLVARLAAAAADLRNAANGTRDIDRALSLDGCVPVGSVDVAVEGPRGTIGLSLRSNGSERPVHVEWRRPSAAALRVLPDLLRGQTVADAEIIVASFDIAMAEADG